MHRRWVRITPYAIADIITIQRRVSIISTAVRFINADDIDCLGINCEFVSFDLFSYCVVETTL